MNRIDRLLTRVHMRPLLHLFLLLVLAIGFSGCGGGGGSAVSVRYETNWTKRANANGGLSQRLTFLDGNGKTVKVFTADSASASKISYRIEGLSGGRYRLKIELFSGHNLGGVLTGLVETYLDVAGETFFQTEVGESVASVSVNPGAASIQIPESLQFLAVGLDIRGIPTFSPPNAFAWQALGGVAQVDSSGRATAQHEGIGSVRATHSQSGALSAASVTVQPFTPQRAKWTVMVYLNAANDLYSYSKLNVNQMERVTKGSDVRFVVQWKLAAGLFPNSQFNGTRRIYVKPDSSEQIASQVVQDLGTGVDMGRPQTLRDFIEWTKTYYPADHYCLVLWNHGNGWRRTAERGGKPLAFSYDDERGTAIQIWELNQALGANKFDILAWDCSLMQMMEVAYEVRGNADYVVGSEESPPGEGYPYDAVFGPMFATPTAPAATLARGFVDGMLNVPAYQSRKITQSIIDSSKLSALAIAVGNLGNALDQNRASLTAVVPGVRNSAQAYSPTTLRFYRDLKDVCDRLSSLTSIAAVDNACAAVNTALSHAIFYEGHNENSANSHGLAIDFSPGSIFTGAASDYSKMRFATDTHWDEWLTFAP